MVTKAKSNGQAVLEAWVAFIQSWIVFPEAPQGSALLLALWAMHTWFTSKWPATSYVHVTSDGPGCGKTTLMEVLASLSLNARMRVTMRALAVVRDIEATQSAVTYFFDQVEALNAPKITDETSILLSGYKDGGRHGITSGKEQTSFSTYCPKMFACIGAIHPDLRSRSIVVKLTFGQALRVWSDEVMTRGGDVARLLEMAAVWFGSKGYAMRRGVVANAPTWVPTPGFVGRDREVYTPLWSVAQVLDLDGEMLTAITTAMHDHIAFKSEYEQQSYRELRAVRGGENDARESADAVQVLHDLVSILPATMNGDVATEFALASLKALPHGGKWRMYRGKGLDAVSLAGLLKRFEVGDGQTLGVEPVRMERGGKQFKGYRGRKLRAALARIEAQRTAAVQS